jgi:hypothetical protein
VIYLVLVDRAFQALQNVYIFPPSYLIELDENSWRRQLGKLATFHVVGMLHASCFQ